MRRRRPFRQCRAATTVLAGGAGAVGGGGNGGGGKCSGGRSAASGAMPDRGFRGATGYPTDASPNGAPDAGSRRRARHGPEASAQHHPPLHRPHRHRQRQLVQQKTHQRHQPPYRGAGQAHSALASHWPSHCRLPEAFEYRHSAGRAGVRRSLTRLVRRSGRQSGSVERPRQHPKQRTKECSPVLWGLGHAIWRRGHTEQVTDARCPASSRSN
mmetsp:Transcript_6195/g.12339  ORF Transcript_6195/g.12339 Transcript_6195/m.12339 type:complete len:213 (+) Transcript_6195:431-1069(+)